MGNTAMLESIAEERDRLKRALTEREKEIGELKRGLHITNAPEYVYFIAINIDEDNPNALIKGFIDGDKFTQKIQYGKITGLQVGTAVAKPLSKRDCAACNRANEAMCTVEECAEEMKKLGGTGK